MQNSREMLEAHLEKYEQELRELNSFITELNTMTGKHDTPAEHFEEDLTEAKHNVAYYENEIARIKKELESLDGKPALSKEKILGAVIISSISFAAGLLLGSGWRRENQ